MAKSEVYEAAGFSFATKEMADLAAEEEKKVYYVRARLNFSDMPSVLLIYNKMLKGEVFKTPVGMVFLKSIHDRLLKDGSIKPEEVDAVPAGASYNDDGKVSDPFSEEERRSYERKYQVHKIITGVCIVLIIAMFYITMTADNPNILNYETALQNRYSEWEQQLREKENSLREWEQQLNEREDNNQ